MLHNSNIHRCAATAELLITENNAKRHKDGMMIIKPGSLMAGNTNVVRCVILHTVPIIIRPDLCLENVQESLLFLNACFQLGYVEVDL